MEKWKILGIVLLLISTIFLAAHATDVKAVEFKLSWTTKAPMPTPRAQTAIAVGDDGKIYAMGGYNQTNVLDVVEAYNLPTDTWETRATMIEAVQAAATTRGQDGLIYVISGHNASTWTPTVQTCNLTSNTWTKKADAPFPVTFAAAATGDDGKIYVLGGTEPEGVEDTDKLQIYDPETDTWILGTSLSAPRTQLGAVKDRNGFIYSIGGQTLPATPEALNIVEVYDPHSETWSRRTPMPEGKNEFGAMLGADGNIYVIGGGHSYENNDPPFFGTVMVYDPLANTWGFDANMPTPRKELGAVTIDESIYAIGGCNGTFLNTVEEAKIAMPNNPPKAYINSINPNPAVEKQEVILIGGGMDADGTIIAYKWRSSLDGIIGNQPAISISDLSIGVHTIYFSVQDNDHEWSTEAVAILVIEKPIMEDPIYQRLGELNQTVNDLTNYTNNLNQTIDNLASKVEDLSNKLDNLTMQFMRLGTCTIILIIALIVLVYATRKKVSSSATPPSAPSPPPQSSS